MFRKFDTPAFAKDIFLIYNILEIYYDVVVKTSFSPDYDASRSTLRVLAPLKHSQSATYVATCSCFAGPNPTFVAASCAKWAFDPCIIIIEGMPFRQ